MSIPRQEYPRPDFERSVWYNLNGEWNFSFDDADVGKTERWYEGKGLERKIVVPFCYQSKLSGIEDNSLHEILWYSREFTLPGAFAGKRVLLHFGAVDYRAEIWINGEMAGEHRGGHTSFKLDVTRFVKAGANRITVRVEDRYECVQPRGKQYWKVKPDRCWYTPTSGIWQTVWLEAVGEVAFDRVRFTPDIDHRNVLSEIHLDRSLPGVELGVEVTYKGDKVKSLLTALSNRITKLTLDFREEDYIDEHHYWTPETPNLFEVELKLFKNGTEWDCVKTYFGMRKISVHDDYIMLNNKPYYQKLILDQGYWPESLLTPPSDEAIRYDIEMTKKFGFNGARKHQKIEDPRYYYWADKLGLLVWGEMPSPYDYNAEEIENVTREWTEFINRDYNHPCIVTWVPLNESWGVRNIIADKSQQSFAQSLYYLTKALDQTRLISTNDGWEQVTSDINAIHDYIERGENFAARYADRETAMKKGGGWRIPYAYGFRDEGKPMLITEYGGIAFQSESGENWGYGGAARDEEAFFERYDCITKAIKEISYICGYCYTQLTDVMQEINGLMTADRIPKVDVERVRKVNL